MSSTVKKSNYSNDSPNNLITTINDLSKKIRSSSIVFNQIEVINIESASPSSAAVTDIDIFGNIHLGQRFS